MSAAGASSSGDPRHDWSLTGLRHEQVRPGLPGCANCGYDLVGLTVRDVCPECGHPVIASLDPRLLRFREPRESRRLLFAISLLRAAVFGIVVCWLSLSVTGARRFAYLDALELGCMLALLLFLITWIVGAALLGLAPSVRRTSTSQTSRALPLIASLGLLIAAVLAVLVSLAQPQWGTAPPEHRVITLGALVLAGLGSFGLVVDRLSALRLRVDLAGQRGQTAAAVQSLGLLALCSLVRFFLLIAAEFDDGNPFVWMAVDIFTLLSGAAFGVFTLILLTGFRGGVKRELAAARVLRSDTRSESPGKVPATL